MTDHFLYLALSFGFVFLIPTDIAWYVLNRKIIKPFKLYLYMKSQSSGKLKINREFIKKAKRILHYTSSRSIKNNLDRLIQLDFIGHNPKSGVYFIRGWNYLQLKIGCRQRTAALYDSNNFDQLQEFLFATTIRKKQRWEQSGAAQFRGSANQSRIRFSPLSLRLLADMLGISVWACETLKEKAVKAGFLEIKESWEPTMFDKEYYESFIKYSENVPQIRIIEGKIHLRKPDRIKSNIKIMRRKWKKKVQY